MSQAVYKLRCACGFEFATLTQASEDPVPVLYCPICQTGATFSLEAIERAKVPAFVLGDEWPEVIGE